jgi:hypothetical protein
LFALGAPHYALAQGAGAAVVGKVTTSDGVAIAEATVVLSGNGPERSARTGPDGTFAFADVPGGTYGIRAHAKSYDLLTGRTIDVAGAGTSIVNLQMSRSASSLSVIGQVQSNGTRALSNSATPTTSIDTQAYAELGYTNMAEVLQNDISTTLIRPLGGSPGLPTSVALRGPDPTETLVDIDGHQVNNGNTGDFDLALLDPADYSVTELVEGISPSSLVGPTTIDGAINIRTLEPTQDPHETLRFSYGSFGSAAETMDATGTIGHLGYAFSLHRTTSGGEVNQSIVDVSQSPAPIVSVGSAVDSSTALGKLRYSFGRGDASYVDFTFHDQSTFRDLSAALSSFPGSGSGVSPYAPSGLPQLDGFEGTTEQSHNVSYGFDVQTPLGQTDSSGLARTTLQFRHLSSYVSASVFGPGTDSSPYLDNYRDPIDDEILQLDHQLPRGTLTFQYEIRSEQLVTDYVPGGENVESIARRVPEAAEGGILLDADSTADPGVDTVPIGQTQRSAVLRYVADPTAKLHYSFATYYSRFSAWGSSIDPRFAFVWTPTAQSLARFSLGTTYQTPQLPELLVLPNTPPVGGFISTGNPNLKPDRATEYGLGFEHLFGGPGQTTRVSLDLYRVNLRTPASSLVVEPSTNPDCNPAAGDDAFERNLAATSPCPVSYPVNAGDGIYQGIELRAERPVARWTTLSLGWAVRSAYLTAFPANIQDGTLVLGEQNQGLPLDKATVSLSRRPPLGFEYGAGAVYEGINNELDQPQFVTLNASIGYRTRDWEVSLNGTNLTDVYDQRFTITNGGVPYGAVGPPITTDAYALQGTALTATITRRI